MSDQNKDFLLTIVTICYNAENLIEKTIAEIEDKKIQPTSRKYFSLRNIIFWSSAILMLIFSSFAVSLILAQLEFS